MSRVIVKFMFVFDIVWTLNYCVYMHLVLKLALCNIHTYLVEKK